MRIQKLRDGGHRLGLSAPYLKGDVEFDRRRRAESATRKLYSTARWIDLRWAVLVDAHFRCVRCGRSHPDLTPTCDALALHGLLDQIDRRPAPGFVADHRIPHRGDLNLFWDRDNLQCLCGPCHSGAKQREEQGSRRQPGT